MKLKRSTISKRDDYFDLIQQHPLRVIRNERELEAASAFALQLAIKSANALSSGESDYLDVLDRLIEDYEDIHHPLPLSKSTPLQRLKSLVHEAHLSASDLGRLLGNRSLGSLLLTGKRALSKSHIRILAAHFKLDAGYFL